MGNHDIGRAMATAAEVFWEANEGAAVTQEKARRILDIAAERYTGGDAEFDDELSPKTPLGRLVTIAFGPKKRGESWTDGPYTRFNETYGFG